jgi:hypothetical protein
MNVEGAGPFINFLPSKDSPTTRFLIELILDRQSNKVRIDCLIYMIRIVNLEKGMIDIVRRTYMKLDGPIL